MTRKSGLERCLELVPSNVPIYEIPEHVAMNQLVGFDFHQGVMAIGRRSALPTAQQGFEKFFTGEARRALDTASLAKQPIARRRRAWVVLPDATKPDNLGLAFRCAAALDAEAVVLGEKCCDPFSRRALRVSMGGVLQTPVYQARNLSEEIKLVRERWNVPFFATTLDEVAISSYDHGVSVLAQRQYVAFVFGNEYSGLTAETIALCDQSVKIPMHGDVDSLNLGVSVGIFLYEFNRWNAR